MTATEKVTALDESTRKSVEEAIGKAVNFTSKAETHIRQNMVTVMYTVPLMDDAKFWELVEDFFNKRLSALSGQKERHEAVARVLAREFTYGSFQDAGIYTFLSFAKTYAAKVKALYTPLFGVIKGFGDDGYGDILDSFPLFGRDRYEEALLGKITGDSEEQYQGENYVSMHLNDAAQKFFGSYARDKRGEEDDHAGLL